ncbi:sugar-binding transcriptional regulator [Photobacterium rosenbergii]|uniref:sugar-binding transcriptional regulator n=1 Tax=Photobacterium rosenbergii TaxID=294936 RepID=UPI001C992B89|nr:sugar-binding transcriptional regulator [Photobacterium rosenbergii]MBY5944617.1 sugar-binding transcriptional regulator [Photobacterium rosenbergii]
MKATVLDNISAFNNDPVLHATWLYYHEGLSQTEVAKLMGVSRVTVVKYLQTAREKGLVQINLDFNAFSSISVSLLIKEKFDLERVIIVPDGEHAKQRQDSALMRERLANAGGAYLNQVIENGDTLGVAWGRTIHQMGNIMTPKSCKDVTVMQMLGSMPAQPDFTTIESSSQIANKLSGRVMSLHVPAVVSSSRLAIELQAEPIIRANFDALTKCNKAFFVVGNALDENPLIRVGVISKKEMQTYRDLGAVGVICGRFYDKLGQPVVAEVDLRILGISLAQLRQVKRRIFIAGGERNFDATLGAILGGYVSDLIIDESTAEFLADCSIPSLD